MAAGHRAIVIDRMYLRQVPRPRVFRDGSNPLEDLREEERFARYRFQPDTIYFIIDLCQAAARDTGRCFAIPLVLCVLCYLRFLATGAFQLTVGDTVNLPAHSKQSLPPGFLNVVRVIDCTHVSIKKPSANPEDYIGRKGFPTINVQAVVNASYRITSAVVVWPGWTHDARIWRQCALRRNFEDGDMQGFYLLTVAMPVQGAEILASMYPLAFNHPLMHANLLVT
ncbi:putative nuclease HARBI1 [Mya arenaria]|uniref:putative nuclease HARBI1 n=1 Tax=Mya arenaria TaxID=6604 RepID=UPI0022E25B8C|nr:putative nuclease HARBI1 [Mya arenaria]